MTLEGLEGVANSLRTFFEHQMYAYILFSELGVLMYFICVFCAPSFDTFLRT